MTPPGPTFLEFFAGGGMCRAGLGAEWRCLFANDFDAKKGRAYVANHGGGAFVGGDIHALTADDLPDIADLAWASFPCQDLSLAGNRAGLDGARSGAFRGFQSLVEGLRKQGRAPRLLALENVTGALTSNGGADFVELCRAIDGLGYVFGALVIDAALFTPQSRPRLFIVAARRDVALPRGLTREAPDGPFVSPALVRAQAMLPDALKRGWRWWALPAPARRNLALADLVEENPGDVTWHTRAQTARLLSMMSDVNRDKLGAARASGARVVGTIFRRTRRDPDGARRQRAEVRFDGLAGCLRTPGGGSSRQFLVVVEGARVRTRLLSGREAARLMGLPDDYVLPARHNEALHLLGDGVVAPVVAHLRQHLFGPLRANAVDALAAAE